MNYKIVHFLTMVGALFSVPCVESSARSTLLKRILVILPLALLFLSWPASAAEAFPLDKNNEILGKAIRYTVKENESLYEIARKYKTGFNEITAANPGIDPFVPGAGTRLILPTSWILPDASSAPGIVINISGM